MKHFGAVLSGDNNILDGGESSVLTIGTAAANNDVIIIHNDNTTTGGTDAAADGSVFGLVLVPSVSGRGSTHILGADGREVAITSVGGGINTALNIPIVNAAGDAFVDSSLTQTSTVDGAQAVTAGGSFIIAGDLQVNGTTTTVNSATVTIDDRFLNLGDTGIGASTVTTNLTGGIIVETDRNADGTTKVYGGLRYNGSTDTWQVSSAPQADGLAADSEWSDLGVAGAGVQSVVGGAGITVDITDTNNPIASVALTADAAGAGGLAFTGAGAAGTLGIDTEGITEQMLNVPAVAGVGLSGQVLTLLDATAGTFAWVTAAVGTVQKYTEVLTKAAADTGFTIVADSATGHGLIGQDFTIVLYEQIIDSTGGNGGFRQFIPESMLIQDGTGTGTAGDVVVTTGATAADLTVKIVIKA